MKSPKVSLDQWRTLQTVIDAGGYAQAARQLHRSQSSVSYAVNQLQSRLNLKLLQINGRKAILTEAGKLLLQRSRQLITEASSIEQQARQIQQGWESEVRLAVEASYPTQLIMDALQRFQPLGNATRIRLDEVVLSGAEELLLNGETDLAISPIIPPGFLADELLRVGFTAVAHPDHPLHRLGRPISSHDLSRETHVIVSDSGSKGIDAGWITDSLRWTVSSPESAHKIISNGLGFGWLPDKEIEDELAKGRLKILPLTAGQHETAILYLVYAELDQAGPATRQLAEILKQVSAETKMA